MYYYYTKSGCKTIPSASIMIRSTRVLRTVSHTVALIVSRPSKRSWYFSSNVQHPSSETPRVDTGAYLLVLTFAVQLCRSMDGHRVRWCGGSPEQIMRKV